MFILPLLAAAAANCVWPDTPDHVRRIEGGVAVECKAKPDPLRKVTPAEQVAIRKYFDRVLLDGSSARYDFGYYNGGLICGAVNGKNSFGAYVGWKPFIYNAKDGNGQIYQDNDAYLYKALCVEPYEKK